MAMLTRWDPFRDLQRMQDEMSRIFDERLVSRGGESVGWTPNVDIFEGQTKMENLSSDRKSAPAATPIAAVKS